MWFLIYWCWFVMCVYVSIYIWVVVHTKNKKTKKKWLPWVPGHLALGEGYINKNGRGLPRVPMHLALGEGCLKKQRGLPWVPRHGHSGKRFSKKNEFLPRMLHSGKRFQNKKKRNFFPECCTRGRVKKKGNGANGVKSSPSGRMALGEGFPECMIFGTRGRPLSRERHPRRLFPECCSRGRLPRVFWGLPRVHLALGEAAASCSG
jgi:hypothetical protein